MGCSLMLGLSIQLFLFFIQFVDRRTVSIVYSAHFNHPPLLSVCCLFFRSALFWSTVNKLKVRNSMMPMLSPRFTLTSNHQQNTPASVSISASLKFINFYLTQKRKGKIGLLLFPERHVSYQADYMKSQIVPKCTLK